MRVSKNMTVDYVNSLLSGVIISLELSSATHAGLTKAPTWPHIQETCRQWRAVETPVPEIVGMYTIVEEERE